MSTDQLIDFGDPAGNAGSLDVEWIHGSPSAKHNTDPDIQVHRYNEHTVILRQNMAINYEAPFIYLLFGNTRALLLDTGATTSPELFPVRSVVDSLIERWLDVHPRSRTNCWSCTLTATVITSRETGSFGTAGTQ